MDMDEPKRWAKGLAIMQEMHRRARDAGNPIARPRGRPRIERERMSASLLQAAMSGFVKA